MKTGPDRVPLQAFGVLWRRLQPFRVDEDVPPRRRQLLMRLVMISGRAGGSLQPDLHPSFSTIRLGLPETQASTG